MPDSETKQRPVRKLTVRNFSVIKDAELQFGKITVLIGPQSSGKSLLCRLAYFLEQVVPELTFYGLSIPGAPNLIEEQIINSFLSFFPKEEIEGQRFQIVYEVEPSYSIGIEMTDTSPTPNLTWKNGLAETLMAWISNSPKRSPSFQSDRRREFMSGIDIGPMPIKSDSVYISTGRAFFSSPNKAFAALATKNLDWITNRFATEFDAEYSVLRESYRTNRTLLSELGAGSVEVLQGKVVKEDNRLLFESAQDGNKRRFEILSSGTLELLPIFNILAQVAKKTGDPTHPNMPSPSVGMVFIEEPELSVFPETQYQFAKLIALLGKSESLWMSYAITTHSPYILSAFGNLIKAGQVAHARPELAEDLKKVTPEKYWINPEEFRAYALKPSESARGKFQTESIIDKKTGQIDGDYLDNVSSDIAEEFGQLLELQYGGQ